MDYVDLFGREYGWRKEDTEKLTVTDATQLVLRVIRQRREQARAMQGHN